MVAGQEQVLTLVEGGDKAKAHYNDSKGDTRQMLSDLDTALTFVALSYSYNSVAIGLLFCPGTYGNAIDPIESGRIWDT